jgi:hypothetical protein
MSVSQETIRVAKMCFDCSRIQGAGFNCLVDGVNLKKQIEREEAGMCSDAVVMNPENTRMLKKGKQKLQQTWSWIRSFK